MQCHHAQNDSTPRTTLSALASSTLSRWIAALLSVNFRLATLLTLPVIVCSSGSLVHLPSEAHQRAISMNSKMRHIVHLFHPELALLRAQSSDRYTASPTTIAAATRVFNSVDFRGYTQTQIRLLIGVPSRHNSHRLVDWYCFHNGEQGIIREFVYDKHHRVILVRVHLSQ